jgi:GNAT superfamily N-acetyltransferase
MVPVTEPVIRAASPADLPAVARLRGRWQLEREPGLAGAGPDFVEAFVTWAEAHAASHRCLVAAADGALVGMAWLAVLSRVPAVGRVERVSADVQSVYVVPEWRGRDVGRRLVDAALAEADAAGAEWVSVHSSARAVPVYERAGFSVVPHLLHRRPRPRLGD